MSDDRDKKEDPAEELKQGLTHLWRAARGAAKEVQKEVERTDFGKEISGAGREFVRAAANVVDRLADEVSDLTRQRPPGPPPGAPPPGGSGAAPPDDDEFDGVKPKTPPGGAAPPGDPGFRIAVDEDKKKG